MSEQTELPKGADFTLVVPLDRGGKNNATFHIKELTEDVFMAAKSMIDKGKDYDAVRMVIKALWVGGDSTDLLVGNFVAINSASKLILELIQPIQGDLKKN